MNKMSDGFKLIGWCINVLKSIGGFRANSRHTKSTDAKKMFKNSGLFETNVFNRNKIDYISRAGKREVTVFWIKRLLVT